MGQGRGVAYTGLFIERVMLRDVGASVIGRHPHPLPPHQMRGFNSLYIPPRKKCIKKGRIKAGQMSGYEEVRQRIIGSYGTGTARDKYRQYGQYKAERFKSDKGYMFHCGKNAVKCWMDQPLPVEFKEAELGRLWKMTWWIEADSNRLSYIGNGGIRKPLTRTLLAKRLGITQRTCDNFVWKLLRAGLLKKSEIMTKDGRAWEFYMNPLYFFAGKWLPPWTYFLFKEELDEYLPEWVIERYCEV